VHFNRLALQKRHCGQAETETSKENDGTSIKVRKTGTSQLPVGKILADSVAG
jgi:hypothetical protein